MLIKPYCKHKVKYHLQMIKKYCNLHTKKYRTDKWKQRISLTSVEITSFGHKKGVFLFSEIWYTIYLSLHDRKTLLTARRVFVCAFVSHNLLHHHINYNEKNYTDQHLMKYPEADRYQISPIMRHRNANHYIILSR